MAQSPPLSERSPSSPLALHSNHSGPYLLLFFKDDAFCMSPFSPHAISILLPLRSIPLPSTPPSTSVRSGLSDPYYTIYSRSFIIALAKLSQISFLSWASLPVTPAFTSGKSTLSFLPPRLNLILLPTTSEFWGHSLLLLLFLCRFFVLKGQLPLPAVVRFSIVMRFNV